MVIMQVHVWSLKRGSPNGVFFNVNSNHGGSNPFGAAVGEIAARLGI
jgi:hypothetical protein